MGTIVDTFKSFMMKFVIVLALVVFTVCSAVHHGQTRSDLKRILAALSKKEACTCPPEEFPEAEEEESNWNEGGWAGDDAFVCTDGFKIPASWKNDNIDDCGDCSDEPDCGCVITNEDEMPWIAEGCLEDRKKKRALSKKFDTCTCGAGVEVDWPEDGSDPPNSFTCPDGWTIPPEYVNDMMDDCGDCSDEPECGCVVTEATAEEEYPMPWAEDSCWGGDGGPTGAEGATGAQRRRHVARHEEPPKRDGALTRKLRKLVLSRKRGNF